MERIGESNILLEIDMEKANKHISAMEAATENYNHRALRLFISMFIEDQLQQNIAQWIKSKYGVECVAPMYAAIDGLIDELRPEPRQDFRRFSLLTSKINGTPIEQIQVDGQQAIALLKEFLIEFGSNPDLSDEKRDVLYRFIELSKNDLNFNSRI